MAESEPQLDHDDETTDLRRDERRETSRAGPEWWRRRMVDPDERNEVLGRLFFEGERRRPYLFRFSVMLTLSIVIAVLGVIADSAAIVIGAMLLAPMMTPVLSIAAALVMVWPRRVGRSLLLIATSSAICVGLAWLVAWLVPDAQITVLPNELTSRTSPTLLDLVVALAAGIAGAYALVREDVGTSLPGVAVAVALVPPLAVAGASIELGHPDLAQGAMLLYLSNLTAIVLAGGLAFLATGFVPGVRISRLSSKVAVSVAAAIIPVALISVPLAHSFRDSVQRAVNTSTTHEVVEAWIGTRLLEVTDVDVGEGSVKIDVAGSDPPPPAATLGTLLTARTGDPVSVEVRWIERTSDIYHPSAESATTSED